MPKKYLLKSLLISFIVFVFSSSLLSQETNGYYVTFTNDTVHVDFIGLGGGRPNPIDYTWSALYLKNNKKTLLSPKTAKEIFWTLETGNSYRMVSILNTAKFPSPPNRSGLRFFASVIIENEKLNLYIFHTFNGPLYLPANGTINRYFFVKYDGNMLDLGYFGDKKRIKKFLADCPEVVKRLGDKKNKIETYEEIAVLYNSLCGSNIENNPQE